MTDSVQHVSSNSTEIKKSKLVQQYERGVRVNKLIDQANCDRAIRKSGILFLNGWKKSQESYIRCKIIRQIAAEDCTDTEDVRDDCRLATAVGIVIAKLRKGGIGLVTFRGNGNDRESDYSPEPFR